MAKKKKTKENKLVLSNKENEKLSKAPHSFVFSRGDVGINVINLTMDLRKMMEPFTASNLKVKKSNVWKDFVAVGGFLGVTNILSLSKTEKSISLRIARIPKGPTLYFKVHKYTLCKDVTASLKKPHASQEQFKEPPLLVLNNFQKNKNDDKQKDIDYVDPYKLCSTMLQGMLPSINVHELKLSNVKRCVEFSVTEDQKLIEMRHYAITVKPVGISRRMKKLVTRKEVPNLNKLNDVDEFLMQQGEGSASESEAEPDETSQVKLSQKLKGNGNMKNHQSAIRLVEIGPRLTLELIKIQDGVCEGSVLYHKYVDKSEEEIRELEKAKQQKIKEKEIRKKIQEENIKKKEEIKELNKEKSMQAMKRKQEENDESVETKKPKIGFKNKMSKSKFPQKKVSLKGSKNMSGEKKGKSFLKKSKKSSKSN